MKDKTSELLNLLNERRVWEWEGEHQAPTLDHLYQASIDEAVSLHAKLNNSDPFSGNRIRLYLNRGLELPSQIKKEALAGLGARRHAKGGE